MTCPKAKHLSAYLPSYCHEFESESEPRDLKLKWQHLSYHSLPSHVHGCAKPSEVHNNYYDMYQVCTEC